MHIQIWSCLQMLLANREIYNFILYYTNDIFRRSPGRMPLAAWMWTVWTRPSASAWRPSIIPSGHDLGSLFFTYRDQVTLFEVSSRSQRILPWLKTRQVFFQLPSLVCVHQMVHLPPAAWVITFAADPSQWALAVSKPKQAVRRQWRLILCAGGHWY